MGTSMLAPIKLQHQKNVSRFFKSFDIAQVVCVKVNQSKFMVNSIILVLHSSVFEDLIYSGADEIILDDSLQFSGAEELFHNCLLYLHGETISVHLPQVHNFYKFAKIYEVTSLLEDCERAFVELLADIGTFIEYMSNCSLNGEKPCCIDIIKKNSKAIINLVTSYKSLPTILPMIRFESLKVDSAIPKILPCSEMVAKFYAEMTKMVTEPSDKVQLNLIKVKYCSSPVSKTVHAKNGLTPKNNKLTTSSKHPYRERLFVELLTDIRTFTDYMSNCSSIGEKPCCLDLVKKNSEAIIDLVTSSTSLPTIMPMIRFESLKVDSSIPKILPCSEMIAKFYAKMTKIVREPLDAVQLNLIKVKYCSSSTISTTVHAKNGLTSQSNKLTTPSSSKHPGSDVCHKTQCNQMSQQLNSSGIQEDTKNQFKNEGSTKRRSSTSSSASKSDCSSRKTDPLIKDCSKLSTLDRNSSLLSMSFNSIIQLVKSINQDDIQNYLKIDIFLTWLLFKKYPLDDNGYSTFCSSFNNKLLAREFVADLKEVLSNIQNSYRIVDVKNEKDCTFFVSSDVISQKNIQTMIHGNCSIALRETSSLCQVTSCQISNHKLQLFVILKKTLNDSASTCGLSNSSNFHEGHILHFYLLGLNKSLFVKNILSLKVLTKAEILKKCHLYPNFVLKVIYGKEMKSGTTKLRLVSSEANNSKLVNTKPLASSQKSEKLLENENKNFGYSEVFKTRSWEKFSFPDHPKFIKTGYTDGIQQQLFDIKSKSDFVYIGIDLFFTWLLLGKSTLKSDFYQPIICSFDHSLLSAEYVKDVKQVFNSVLSEAVPVVAKRASKDSFVVSASLEKEDLVHFIKNNGCIVSGEMGGPCQVDGCEIENHSLQMHIKLNKSTNDFTVHPEASLNHQTIHNADILHFYLLALDINDSPVQLISLKVSSKEEVLRFVKLFPKCMLRVIYHLSKVKK